MCLIQCFWMLGANEVNRPFKENQDSQDYCLTKGDIAKSVFSSVEKGRSYTGWIIASTVLKTMAESCCLYQSRLWICNCPCRNAYSVASLRKSKCCIWLECERNICPKAISHLHTYFFEIPRDSTFSLFHNKSHKLSTACQNIKGHLLKPKSQHVFKILDEMVIWVGISSLAYLN